MNDRPIISWPGLVLVLAGVGGMLAAGAGWWLTATVGLLWLGSLLLVRAEPEPEPHPPGGSDGAMPVRDAMAAAIEPIGFPLLVLENQRVAMANAAARRALGAHILGQDARIALRHPEAMRLLDVTEGDSVTIPGFTGGRSLWQLTRRRIDDRLWLIELFDRSAEADISRSHTDFVANASHELRTPLAAIIGYVETLAEADEVTETGEKPATRTELAPQTRARFHQTVMREARRMQTLVTDLMSLSLVEAEKHDPPTDHIDLGRLVERVVGEITAIAGKDRVTVSVPKQVVEVEGDRAQLEQLVRNLVDNALKYGDPGQPVAVNLKEVPASPRNRAGLELSVADKGAGIAPEHLPHLTRRFYRTDPGRSRAAGGTGLGLAIVKHIVERHGGRLDIASTPGQGTTVKVTLVPVTAPAATPEAVA